MKILIVGSFQWEMYAPAFYHAWRDMGHEVERIDYTNYSFKRKTPLASFLNRVQNRYHYGFFMRRYNSDILVKVNDFKPDFVFLYRCYHVYGDTVEIIRKQTVVFSYNNDDPFSGVPSGLYYRNYFADARYCHLNYVYRKKNVEDFKVIGVNNTEVLLPYFRKASNYPIDTDKDVPLAFLGHFENDGRDKYIYELKQAGVPVVVYGDEHWANAPLYEEIKDVVFPAKRGEEYNEIINRARICLVFFSKLNHDTYTRRCFEIPAAKSVMLSEYTEDMNELFPENECAIYFRNTEELIRKSAYLLENNSEIERIANNALKRVLELGGSEFDRCQQIIEDYKRISSAINE